ncbi:MAG TPA: NadS family protein [Candidatus Rifleibacterium sp.]|nr:NadS family protein [Candidatus Rifleibacterium sp.]
MKNKDFNRLIEGVKQFVQIKRGEMKPSRVFEFTALDVKALRESLHKSQSEFARMIGVSLATLQNWEQGRRKPVGPAKALLRVVQMQPDAVLKALAA